MKLKYLSSDYVPKGDLKGFPLEVIDKMIQRQVEQGNAPNVEIFEKRSTRDDTHKGFWWDGTEEKHDFWKDVILNKNFYLFFKKFPKTDEKELPLPRVIEVRDGEDDDWVRRVVILFKNDEVICYSNAETLEETDGKYLISCWKYWREVQEESKPEYKPFDFQDGVSDYLDLIGKKIVSKDGESCAMVINKISYDGELSKSLINDINAVSIFEYYTFEDGSSVGIRID